MREKPIDRVGLEVNGKPVLAPGLIEQTQGTAAEDVHERAAGAITPVQLAVGQHLRVEMGQRS